MKQAYEALANTASGDVNEPLAQNRYLCGSSLGQDHFKIAFDERGASLDQCALDALMPGDHFLTNEADAIPKNIERDAAPGMLRVQFENQTTIIDG